MAEERTFFECVQDALGRLREHLRSLVSESAAVELRGKLEASEREKLRIVEAVERFVGETVPPPAPEQPALGDPPVQDPPVPEAVAQAQEEQAA